MFLGIEIGGTKLQLGLGEGDGKIVALWRSSVVPEAGAEGVLQQIQQAIPELLSKAALNRSQLRGVGIGFGGPVDDATRTVIKSHQIKGWDDFPLAKWTEERLGCPAVLGNDADVAGLGEALFGAGKGLSPIFYITIGSGIGGGLIIDGEIYRGCGKGAAEIGHVRIGFDVKHGFDDVRKYVVLEDLASGWSIADGARAEVVVRDDREAKKLLTTVNNDPDRISAREVAQSAASGGLIAQSILKGAWDNLAQAIGHVITLLCPRRIVIGGGVSSIGEKLLFEPLRELVAQRIFKPFTNCYDIVPAALGEEVVVHGALALAARKLQSQR